MATAKSPKKTTKTTKTTTKKSAGDENFVLTEQEAQTSADSLFAPLALPYLQSFIMRLKVLAQNKPQLLLLEGASKELRLSVAKYWACIFNCEKEDAPCAHCVSCLEIANDITPDFIMYNGLEERIKIEPMRELIPLISNPPTTLKKRIVLFYEANAFTEQAANALLKTLEEPNSTTLFILTVSQRSALLPTLVSRSALFTLPTQVHVKATDIENDALNALYSFFTTGTGFFENYTGKAGKSGFSIDQARLITQLLIRYLALSYNAKQNFEVHALASYLASKITVEKSFIMTHFIEESQDNIENSTAPNCPLIIDALLLQLYMLLNE